MAGTNQITQFNFTLAHHNPSYNLNRIWLRKKKNMGSKRCLLLLFFNVKVSDDISANFCLPISISLNYSVFSLTFNYNFWHGLIKISCSSL